MGFLTRKSTFSNLYQFYSETDTKIESIPCVDFLKSKNYRVILVQALIYSITKCKVICNITPQIDYSTGPDYFSLTAEIESLTTLLTADPQHPRPQIHRVRICCVQRNVQTPTRVRARSQCYKTFFFRNFVRKKLVVLVSGVV